MLHHHEAEQLLKDATKAIYKKYGKVKGRRGWADMSEEMDHAAETKFCAELTQPEYDHLSWHAMCWANSDPDTVRYFLPRMFEDMAAGAAAHTYDEMVIRALGHSRWRFWPRHEIDIIENWFNAWWNATLCFPFCHLSEGGSARHGFPENRRAAYCLKLIAFSGMQIQPLLDLWQNQRTFEAIAQLADFLNELDGYLSAGEMYGWSKVWGEDGIDAECQSVAMAWLRSRDVSQQLEDAFFRPEFASIADDISSALVFASGSFPYRSA